MHILYLAFSSFSFHVGSLSSIIDSFVISPLHLSFIQGSLSGAAKNLSMHVFLVGELLHMCSPCHDVVYLRTLISNPVDDQVRVLLAVECVSQSQV